MDLPDLFLYACGMSVIALMIVVGHLLFPETPEEKAYLRRLRDQEMLDELRAKREGLQRGAFVPRRLPRTPLVRLSPPPRRGRPPRRRRP